MGMLMHQTWLNEQKKKAVKPVEQKAKVAEKEEPETEPKKAGRRKAK